MENPGFDLQEALRHFAAHCFNKTWEYIDNPNRSPDDDLAMLQTAMTSLWHWSEREDATPQNLSVGNWQVSRVFALLGQADNARRYAEMSLRYAEGQEPFYAGFAYEALARAEMTAGNTDKMRDCLEKAFTLAGQVADEEDRKMLIDDLKSMG